MPNQKYSRSVWFFSSATATTIKLMGWKSKVVNSTPITFVFVLLFLLVSSDLVAGGVYKWIDEKGVTHFSSHPPKKNSFRVENINSNKVDSDKRRLNGSWWSFKSDRSTRNLIFNYRGFRVNEYYFINGSVREKEISKGSYRIEGNSLRFFYEERVDGSVGKSDVFVYKIDSVGNLLLENGYYSGLYAKENNESGFVDDLKGRWKDEKGKYYEFSNGKLKKYIGRYRDLVFVGHYKWKGDVIDIEVLADFVNPVEISRGRVDRWDIMGVSENRVYFREEGSNNEKVLFRERR